MKFPDRMALDRALFMLPRCPEREAVIGALLDDGGEYGFFPRYQSLKTVGDLRMPNGHALVAAGPSLREISPETFAWVFAAFDAPEPEPIPPIEDDSGAHAHAPSFDDPAQLLPILDLIVQEGGGGHATFGDRLNRLDLPYIESMRFQDAVAKIVIDPNHYDKVGALMREPDVKMVRAKVQIAVQERAERLAKTEALLDISPLTDQVTEEIMEIVRGTAEPLTIAEIASLPSHQGVPIRRVEQIANDIAETAVRLDQVLTPGERYTQGWNTTLPPTPTPPRKGRGKDERLNERHPYPPGKAKPKSTSKATGALADVLKVD